MISILALLVVSLSSAPLSPQGTSSVCKDGTTSATVGRGACSGHGGVAKTKAAATSKAPPTMAKAATPKVDTAAKKAAVSKAGSKTAAKAKPKE